MAVATYKIYICNEKAPHGAFFHLKIPSILSANAG